METSLTKRKLVKVHNIINFVYNDSKKWQPTFSSKLLDEFACGFLQNDPNYLEKTVGLHIPQTEGYSQSWPIINYAFHKFVIPF